MVALEKRGYVKAGPWTPEAAAEHPEAGTRAPPHRGDRMERAPHPLFLFIPCRCSAPAAQGVPARGLHGHADLHLLRQRRQAGEPRQHAALHSEPTRARAPPTHAPQHDRAPQPVSALGAADQRGRLRPGPGGGQRGGRSGGGGGLPDPVLHELRERAGCEGHLQEADRRLHQEGRGLSQR